MANSTAVISSHIKPLVHRQNCSWASLYSIPSDTQHIGANKGDNGLSMSKNRHLAVYINDVNHFV